MKTIKLFSIIFLFILLPATVYSSTLGDLRISLIEGEVQIHAGETDEWATASINMPLMEGDQILVPERSKVELQLRDGTCIRLDEISSLQILSIEKDIVQVYLATGRAYLRFIGSKYSPLQINTNIASIQALEKSKFRIDLFDENSTEVSVFEGTVYAENNRQRTTVNEGKKLSLIGEFYADLRSSSPSDSWERWNQERDRELYALHYSSRYLPEELSAYSYDFDTYGRWVYLSDYGNCWRPNVYVSVGWSPYRIGRWSWIGGDYVWVSHEPWGWVPYHYGRWVHRASIGWFWVPPARKAVYWGPGYVGWVYTPTHVAWVPLAPREIYYGYGFYGPYSVNITHVNVNKIFVKRVYNNVYVNNAVTIIKRDTLFTSKPVSVRLDKNPFLTKKIRAGRPDIRPERRTTTPFVKNTTIIKQPTVIRNTQVEYSKEKRSTTRSGSILTSKSTPKADRFSRTTSDAKIQIKKKEVVQTDGRNGKQKNLITTNKKVTSNTIERKALTTRGGQAKDFKLTNEKVTGNPQNQKFTKRSTIEVSKRKSFTDSNQIHRTENAVKTTKLKERTSSYSERNVLSGKDKTFTQRKLPQ